MVPIVSIRQVGETCAPWRVVSWVIWNLFEFRPLSDSLKEAEKGTRFNLCEAPSGPFRQIKPGFFFGPTILTESRSVNILVATSEAVPFSKTGGLADVCGSLPIELARLGHNPAVILPAFRQTRYCGLKIEPMGIDFIVPIGSKTVAGHLLRSTLPGGQVPVYLVQQDQ